MRLVKKMNVSYLLTNSASKYPQRTAIISGEVRSTYKVFNERANRLANAVKALGVTRGDRVGLLLFNTHRFAETYFGLLKLGAIVVPLNWRLAEDEIRFLVNHSEISSLIFDEEFRETIDRNRESFGSVKHFIGVGARSNHLGRDYEEVLGSGSAEEPSTAPDDQDPCQIIYTSATTGRAKGAVLSHRNIIWNTFNTILGREHRSGEISLIVGPLFHTAALNNHFTTQVALGGTSILVKKFDPETVLRYIQEEKVNVISGSPAMFNLLLEYPGLDRFDLRSITKCTSGSAALPEEIKERLFKAFPGAKGVYDLYGCTEASPTITTLSARDSITKKYSVGLPAPFVEVRIMDEKGRSLPANEVGELVCRGPNVMQGYWRDEQATAEAIKDGWLHTGDVARADEDGYIYVIDRKKDMIISGGENIYPREVEKVLLRHPGILDVAVIGVPDMKWGEAVKAFVVRKSVEAIDEQEVIQFCKRRLASYKKPSIVEFVKSIPRNAAGKVLKKTLKNDRSQ
jgi:acyl-CoA synthetase (AMP-forming)/AMP-acid ligase II